MDVDDHQFIQERCSCDTGERTRKNTRGAWAKSRWTLLISFLIGFRAVFESANGVSITKYSYYNLILSASFNPTLRYPWFEKIKLAVGMREKPITTKNGHMIPGQNRDAGRRRLLSTGKGNEASSTLLISREHMIRSLLHDRADSSILSYIL